MGMQQAAAKERMAFAASPEGQRQQAERLQQQQAAQAAAQAAQAAQVAQAEQAAQLQAAQLQQQQMVQQQEQMRQQQLQIQQQQMQQQMQLQMQQMQAAAAAQQQLQQQQQPAFVAAAVAVAGSGPGERCASCQRGHHGLCGQPNCNPNCERKGLGAVGSAHSQSNTALGGTPAKLAANRTWMSLYPFEAQGKEELSLNAGEMLTLRDVNDASQGGTNGWVRAASFTLLRWGFVWRCCFHPAS